MSSPSPTLPEVAAARSRIPQLDLEIENLKRSLAARLAERAQCCDVLDRYKYPILTLPAEITSEIFLHFLPRDVEFIPPVGSTSPSFLLQICRRWRDIALGTPALWSSIQVNLYGGRQSESLRKQKLEQLELWLERSRNCPLSIQLWDVPESASIPSAKFVEAITRHASRWQHLDVDLSYDILRGFTDPMPLLRSVSVDPADELPPDTTPPETAVRMFTSAPNLRKAVLSTSFSPFTISLPWSQITNLKAELDVPGALHLLRQTSALEMCTLIIYASDFPASSQLIVVPPLPLRSLNLFWEDGDTDDNIVQLVNSLTLPLLDTLLVSEVLLGSDPIAVLSRLRPQGYPRTIQIFGSRLSYDVYKEAFPDARLTLR